MKTQKLIFLKGGKGGFGNHKFKSSKNIAPKKANPGYPGEEMWVWLEIKFDSRYWNSRTTKCRKI